MFTVKCYTISHKGGVLLKNKIVTNRRSPKNEAALAAAYIKLNPKAAKINDGLDISMVKLKDGTNGVALLPEKINRGRDKNPHRGKDFISDAELKKAK